MPQVDFIFDFASPNAYFVHKVIPQIEARTGATFNYIPCLLGGIFKATGNQAPMMAFAGVKGKLAYDRLEIERFIAEHGLVDFKMNPDFPINTLHLMRAAAALDLQGKARMMKFVEGIFHFMWEDPKNFNDPQVAANVLGELGYDAQELMAQAQSDAAKAHLFANTERAVERGVFGIPTFFVGDEMFFGKDRLAQVEAQIQRQSA
jgi:2-hydroxychromene-2-carboxylate isomerase